MNFLPEFCFVDAKDLYPSNVATILNPQIIFAWILALAEDPDFGSRCYVGVDTGVEEAAEIDISWCHISIYLVRS